MKKQIISLLSILIISCSIVHSEIHLSDYFEESHNESLQKEGFALNKDLQTKYQAIAKNFSKKNSTETNIVTYETLDNGVHVHVGWYIDGCIGTALDGIEAGKQVVIINDSVVGISYDIKFHNGYFTHNYTWAKITSYTNKQVVKSK
jgi:hypothetical protein